MRLNHDLTPTMSAHAVQRCSQMGISTKVAKAIYRTPASVWPCKPRDNQRPDEERFHIVSSHWPNLGVVVAIRGGDTSAPRVVTVLYWAGDGTGVERTEHHDREDCTP